jgi:predicted solute-binding protein
LSFHDEVIIIPGNHGTVAIYFRLFCRPHLQFAIIYFSKIENIGKNQNISAEILAETEKAT